jgi:hypothetical protein
MTQVLYLSHFYKRTELALRIGIFYTAASLSGAFGGLLARGLNAIGPAGGLEGWRVRNDQISPSMCYWLTPTTVDFYHRGYPNVPRYDSKLFIDVPLADSYHSGYLICRFPSELDRVCRLPNHP